MTDLDGFAWIAVSRFEPAVISVPNRPIGEAGTYRADLFRLAGQLKLNSLANEMAAAAESPSEKLVSRLGACEALLMLDPNRAVPPLTRILADSSVPTAAREQAAQQLGRIDRTNARAALLAQLKSAPESVAVIIGAGLAGNRDSAAALLKEIRNGQAPRSCSTSRPSSIA